MFVCKKRLKLDESKRRHEGTRKMRERIRWKGYLGESGVVDEGDVGHLLISEETHSEGIPASGALLGGDVGDGVVCVEI